ncbi:response regulator [Rhizobacter sp. SG703]|uniref:response regulator n=1 Tax=Rhizobacter sp. SG703 TaxID=2587140 RepID=UPI0014473C7D|nr:response regulator [Rhizobacter sp. SG703]NKI93848.1 two-component system response regulator BasR [Rhizobacter sp. SG703]
MHLLLVEDDLELGAELQRALAGHGLTSEWVRSVKHAQTLTTPQPGADDALPFACVLLDLGLPDGEGLQLLQRWRRNGLKLPVIVLTARDALDARVASLDAGADDYVIKPAAPQELASRIRAVTRRSGGHASAVWTVGALQIDSLRREVRLDGVLTALSPKEFQIVAELARHAGEVVSKHRLARAITPLNEPMEFGALEWHIHNLRRKLGDGCIRTVRGVGYSLVE